MIRPKVAPIPPEWAEPFVKDYCRRFGVPFDKDEEGKYGKGVLWMGAVYKDSLRAVCGLFAADELPGELLVYGFYGDGSKHQYVPLRALIEFIEKLPYNNKYGYILAENHKMLRILNKYGWVIRESLVDSRGRNTVKAGKYGKA